MYAIKDELNHFEEKNAKIPKRSDPDPVRLFRINNNATSVKHSLETIFWARKSAFLIFKTPNAAFGPKNFHRQPTTACTVRNILLIFLHPMRGRLQTKD